MWYQKYPWQDRTCYRVSYFLSSINEDKKWLLAAVCPAIFWMNASCLSIVRDLLGHYQAIHFTRNSNIKYQISAERREKMRWDEWGKKNSNECDILVVMSKSRIVRLFVLPSSASTSTSTLAEVSLSFHSSKATRPPGHPPVQTSSEHQYQLNLI